MSEIKPQTPPSQFYRLLDKIVTNERNTKESFDAAVKLAQETGFSDPEIAIFMYDYLKDKIALTTLKRWTKPLKEIEDSSTEIGPSGPDDTEESSSQDQNESEEIDIDEDVPTTTIENPLLKEANTPPTRPPAYTQATQKEIPKDSKDEEIEKLTKINKFLHEEIEKYRAVKKVESTGVFEKDTDCTNHPMYIKAQVKVEEWRQKANELQERIDALDKVIFKPGTEVESPPDIFQVNKDADLTREYFYGNLSPIQAVSKLKQILSSVSKIDIGWRVLE